MIFATFAIRQLADSATFAVYFLPIKTTSSDFS